MRWANLTLDSTAGAAPEPLPLLGDPGAVVRTVDTPEFGGVTFYEVRAKSVINRVPPASTMPFRWTVNPYRGCTHACRYCLSGDTPILLADGRTRRLGDVRVGDAVYGTVQDGTRRRYAVTRVLAHWSTVKRAYRITLADGTALIASGDHRFLTRRGWKYVTGEDRGRDRRPHLTVKSTLVGTGQFAVPPVDNADYRRGYLCGVTWGARPLTPSVHWCKGFLAGVFDAEGSYADGELRIASTNRLMVEQIVSCLRRFDFSFATELGRQSRLVTYVRVQGGLREHLRFFHLADPAVLRKRSIEGQPVRSDARLAVLSVEPLGVDLPLFDITTGTGDFIANGVVSHNCFARGTHEYLNLDAGHDFDSRIVVKVNTPELVRRELAAPRWSGEHIAMGTNVDCYQRAEGRYRLMPGVLAALRDFANPFSVLTKGSLILRDLPLLREAASVTDVTTAVSVGFLDGELWRSVEPGTPRPATRLAVCESLNAAGVRCAVLIAPVLPFLTDAPDQLDATVRAAAAAGATSVTPIALHLRPGAREWYLGWLRRTHPGLVGRYDRLYRGRAYAPRAYRDALAERVRDLARRHGIGRDGGHRGQRGNTGNTGNTGNRGQRPAADRSRDPRPEQLTLL